MELYKKTMILFVIISAVPCINAMNGDAHQYYPNMSEDDLFNLTIEQSANEYNDYYGSSNVDGVNLLYDMLCAEEKTFSNGVSLGKIVSQNNIALILNGRKYQKDSKEYSKFILPLYNIVFKSNGTRAIDISNLVATARLNCDIDTFICHTCTTKSQLSWYKKYAFPILGGAALFGAGSLLTYMLMKSK